MPLLGDINMFSDSDYYSVDLSYFSKPHDLISPIKDPVRRNAGRREIMDADMEFKASGTKRQRTDPLDGANSLSKLAKVYDKRVQETMTVKGLSKQKEDDSNCIITQIGDTVKAPEGIVKNEYKQAPMLTLNQLLLERFKPRGGKRAASKLQSSFRTEKVEFVLMSRKLVATSREELEWELPDKDTYDEVVTAASAEFIADEVSRSDAIIWSSIGQATGVGMFAMSTAKLDLVEQFCLLLRNTALDSLEFETFPKESLLESWSRSSAGETLRSRGNWK